MIKSKKLSESSKFPQRQSREAAGCDVYCNKTGFILPGCKATIKTGVVIDVPIGYVGIVRERSGLSVKFQLELIKTVYYPEENKEIILNFKNKGTHKFEFKAGERIAQIVFVAVENNIEFV
ncbi:hypothetical protein GVAV_002337 [Gurleya vavrai]